MEPIALGNTKILTNYAQKHAHTLKHNDSSSYSVVVRGAIVVFIVVLVFVLFCFLLLVSFLCCFCAYREHMITAWKNGLSFMLVQNTLMTRENRLRVLDELIGFVK